MKQETIEKLLAKREADRLTDEELALLHKLTRRDEVVAGAERKAKAIVTRRRRTLAACVAACVMVVAVGLLFTQHHDTAPMLAQQEAVVKVQEEETILQPVEAMPELTAAVEAEKVAVPATKTDRKRVAKPATKDPVVMCNSQCDADSVISDIWKFLTA